MPQTMLALFGIVLASFLALNQTRGGMVTERRTEAAEMQALASEVAIERMTVLEALPYDQATVGGYADEPSDLTPLGASASAPSVSDPAGDDLDDAHGESVVALYDLRQDATGGAVGGVPLRTTVTVRYVEEADGETVTSTRTRYKRATVTVAPTTAGAEVAQPVVLTQLFSCGSYCTW